MESTLEGESRMSGDPTLEKRRERLRALKERMVSANLRSRSVRLTRTSARTAFDLSRLSTLGTLGDDGQNALGQILSTLGTGNAGGKKIPLLPVKSKGATGAAVIDIHNLFLSNRRLWQERGVADLAVGWPFLEGKTPGGHYLRGPLLLYPARLSRREKGWRFWELSFEGEPILNPPLVHALLRLSQFKLTLEDLLGTDDDKLFRPDPPTWAGILRCLRGLGLPLSNTIDALEELEAFPFRNGEARRDHPDGIFALKHHLVLGLFPKASSVVVEDYDALLEADALPPLGAAASLLALDDAAWEGAGATEHPWLPEDKKPDLGWRLHQVLPSDGSQDQVIEGIRNLQGPGLVVQGPPGTGKSQVLTNLLAATLAEGKRALVICEKRAALDVVADRMESLGLAEPLALVHDAERDRRALFSQLQAQLENLLGGDASPVTTPQDTGQGQAWAQLQGRLLASQKAHAALTHAEGKKPSLWALQEKLLFDDGRPLPDLSDHAANAGESDIWAQAPSMEAVAPAVAAWALPHPLGQRRAWTGETREKKKEILHHAQDLLAILRNLKRAKAELPLAEVIRARALFEKAEGLAEIFASPDAPRSNRFFLFATFMGGHDAHGQWGKLHQHLQTAHQTRKKISRDFLSARREEVEDWKNTLLAMAKNEGRWHRFINPVYLFQRGFFKRLWERWRDGLPAGQSPAPWKTVAEAMAAVDEALCWHDFIAGLPEDAAFFDLGFTGDPDEIKNAIWDLEADHQCLQAFHTLSENLSGLSRRFANLPDLSGVGGEAPAKSDFGQAVVADVGRMMLVKKAEARLLLLGHFFEPHYLNGLRAKLHRGRLDRVLANVEALVKGLDDFDDALKADARCAKLPPFAQAFLRRWRPDSKGTHTLSQDLSTAIYRAWLATALDGREPDVLERPLTSESALTELNAALAAHRSENPRKIQGAHHHDLAAQVSREGDARALRRLLLEVKKAHHRLTLRQLVKRFGQEGLFSLKRVWLCSPDAVASIFPMDPSLFDLIIFDTTITTPATTPTRTTPWPRFWTADPS
jgi:hypothetical protein